MTVRTMWLPIGVGVTTTVLLGALLAPHPPSLSTETTGDPALVRATSELLKTWPGVRDQLSVALIEGEDVRFAYFGADASSEYEIASVTKTFTAALLSEAVQRGEVRADTRLGDLLDLPGAPVAQITLAQLATHSSGLPATPALPPAAFLTDADPYADFDCDALLDQAAHVALGDHKYLYSNMGFALLGQALAAAAHTDYQHLLEERLLTPLALRDTYLPVLPEGLPPGSPTGHTLAGRGAAAWTMNSYAPAGGARSTIGDMATYAAALLGDAAPGSDTMEPRAGADTAGAIGFAWHISDGITWHNGMTGGFASFVGLDRKNHRAVVVLSNTADFVDPIGGALLEEEAR